MKYKAILKELYVGLGLTASLWMLYFVFLENTRPVEYLRWQTFRLLQWTASPARKVQDPQRTPVVIIDISTLRPTPSETGFTPRADLELILLQLVCTPAPDWNKNWNDKWKTWNGDVSNLLCSKDLGKKKRAPPAVIGVDIDFSPQTEADGRWRFIDPASDPSFFQFSEQFDAPVFVGVSRTVDKPWNFWLGLPQYRQLAAALWLQENPEKVLTTGSGAPSFASAIASTYRQRSSAQDSDKQRSVPHELRDIFFEQESETQEAGVRNTVIDYNASNAFKVVQHYNLASEVKRNPDEFSGKIVLIGDAHALDAGSGAFPESDTFRIPLHDGTVGGVEVHAAAVYTLIHPEARFWTLRRPWDLTIDLLLAGAITLFLAYYGYRRGGWPDEKHNRIFFVGGALSVLVLAILFSPFLIWDGCIIVVLSLTLHPYVHEKITRLEHKRKHHVGRESQE